jgi:DNA-binding transcriptional MerR regulator
MSIRTKLFELRRVAAIFGLDPSRLRYWIQSGVLTPSTRRGGRYYYSFVDLIQVKAAAELMVAGVTAIEIRDMLVELREQLPPAIPDGITLRVTATSGDIGVCADGTAVDHPAARFAEQPDALVCAFSTEHLIEQLRGHADDDDDAPPAAVEAVVEVVAPITPDTTERHEQPSAYQCFSHACQAEDSAREDVAELYYERCLSMEPGFAAAHTNLGNIFYRRGCLFEARRCYERALELEPEQTEARYNLANLLDDKGETELAIAELRRVVTRVPEFADAHFNLGVILARVGGVSQARRHFRRYLELDAGSLWAGKARDYLNALFESPVARA